MSEQGQIKEQIAYLKLWIGLLAVSTISLIGWLIGNIATAATILIVAAIVGIIGFIVIVVVFDRLINGLIDKLGDL